MMHARLAFTLKYLATLAYFHAGLSAMLLASSLILERTSLAYLSATCLASSGLVLLVHHRTRTEANEILELPKTER